MAFVHFTHERYRMQICQDHWHELKNAIRRRGLWKLVTSAGYHAAHASWQELEGKLMQSTSDPLLATSLLIAEQACLAFKSEGFTGGDCPLCEVDRNLGEQAVLEWVDTDADLILQVCRERNLVAVEDF